MFRKILFVAALVVPAAAVAAPARQFLEEAIKGDNSETNLGRLIASRGSSAQVRSFGQTLVRDHSRARVEAVAVANRLHVRAPTSMMPEAKSEMRKLARLRGRAFDLEVRQYMINDHHKDIAKFRAQARSGDRRTAALARAQLPTLQKHLSLAQSIRG